MSLASLCNETATLQAPTWAADAYGGQVPTFAAVLSDFPCCLQPRGGKEVLENDQRVWVQAFELYTPTDITAARPGYRVVVDSVNYIVDADHDMAGRGSHFKLSLIRKD
jgi:hypothetical protein